MGDMKRDFIEIVLTATSWQEAQAIADALLDAHLVACVEFIPIKSRYHWHKSIEQADEVKLIMQSIASNFKKVSKVVKNLHSYQTPALHALPIADITDDARQWLTVETRGVRR